MPVELVFPEFSKHRGIGYWRRGSNIWASRRKLFRADQSNRWRYAFHGDSPPIFDRSADFASLVSPNRSGPDLFRFVIIGDTGEGDRSQYSLVPVIRHLKPDFMIINGDVAYPAGRDEDFLEGFFRPYRGLGIPIWAVPGNHEYYSPNKGREFFETFCTRNQGARWANHGLRLVPQPATFWELRDRTGGTPLTVIALDSGQSAYLDGNGKSQPHDTEQHQWLWWRLEEAQKENRRVIVLFHIPGLVGAKHVSKTHMSTAHRMLASFSCIRLVVCAHEHNHQAYSPATFGRYLVSEHNAPALGHAFPHYIVSGHGGATVGHTDFKNEPYPVDDRFPTPDDWREHWRLGTRVVEKYLGKSALGRIVGLFSKGATSDDDYPGLLSFLLVEVSAGGNATVSVFRLDDLRGLYDLQDGAKVPIEDPSIPLSDQEVKKRLQPLLDIGP